MARALGSAARARDGGLNKTTQARDFCTFELKFWIWIRTKSNESTDDDSRDLAFEACEALTYVFHIQKIVFIKKAGKFQKADCVSKTEVKALRIKALKQRVFRVIVPLLRSSWECCLNLETCLLLPMGSVKLQAQEVAIWNKKILQL